MAKQYLVFESENSKLCSINFDGHNYGKCTFCVSLEDIDYASRLKEDGFNVKISIGDNGEPFAYLPVEIGFDKWPPEITYYANGMAFPVTSLEEMARLQGKSFEDFTVVVNPAVKKDGSGFKCWAREMHLVIAESPYRNKYSQYKPYNVSDDSVPFN